MLRFTIVFTLRSHSASVSLIHLLACLKTSTAKHRASVKAKIKMLYAQAPQPSPMVWLGHTKGVLTSESLPLQCGFLLLSYHRCQTSMQSEGFACLLYPLLSLTIIFLRFSLKEALKKSISAAS